MDWPRSAQPIKKYIQIFKKLKNAQKVPQKDPALPLSWLRAASHLLTGKPVDWPRSARPIQKSIQIPPPQKTQKFAQRQTNRQASFIYIDLN